MESMIDHGEDWMIPLLEFREWLAEARENHELRESNRRNGKEGPGPFTLRARRDILRRLLAAQSEVERELIDIEELALIEREWIADGYEGDFWREFKLTPPATYCTDRRGAALV